MHTYLINLDRCPERLDAMQAQLDGLGIPFERVPAVDGLNLPPDLAPYFAHVIHRKPPIIEAGAVGCYASHLRAYQRIVLSDAPYAMVLEDDAVLPANLREIISTALLALPSGWDFVQLAKPPRHAVHELAGLPGGHLVRYSRVPSGAVGYLISRAGAEKMLNPTIERVWAIDTDTRRPWLFGLDVYGVVPPPINHHGAFPSTIRTAGKRWRKGLPRPTPLTWHNMPLHSPAGVAWNIRKLGLAAWARCLAINSALRTWRAIEKTWSTA